MAGGRRLNIKQFKVANTTTGATEQSGRETTPFYSLAQTTLTNDLSQNAVMANKTLTTVTGSTRAHLSRSYIKVVREYTQDVSGADEVYIVDGIMRITFLSAAGSENGSALLYAFSAYSTTAVTDLTWNVAIANSKAQTVGDFFDIELPDPTAYPSLYICFLVVKDVWEKREIVDANNKICRINNIAKFHYCIHPQKCIYDRDKAHYLCLNGLDSKTGIKTRIVIGVEDERHGFYCDAGFSDLIFSISSRLVINEDLI